MLARVLSPDQRPPQIANANVEKPILNSHIDVPQRASLLGLSNQRYARTRQYTILMGGVVYI